MPQEEERRPPSIEHLLADMQGNGKADPHQVAALENFHQRIRRTGMLDTGQVSTGETHEG